MRIHPLGAFCGLSNLMHKTAAGHFHPHIRQTYKTRPEKMSTEAGAASLVNGTPLTKEVVRTFSWL